MLSRSPNPDKSKDGRKALDQCGIYRVENYTRCPQTCPPVIKSMFKMIYETRFMNVSQFAAPPSEDGSASPFDTKAGDDYDGLLKTRAEDLSSICNHPDL